MSDTLFEITLQGADLEKVNRDPSYLRSLCQKEVSRFEDYVRIADPQFRDGFAKFERLAIEGYLYQKVRGHIDANQGAHPVPVEGKNG